MEKILMFVEKISSSENIKRGKEKQTSMKNP
jgi:hypothetical protein